MTTTIIWGLHTAVCIFLILIVLLQQGKGADMGAAFGGGSNTLFGAGGADSILTRVTTITAAIFMITAVILAKPGDRSSGIDSGLFKDVAPAKDAGVELPTKVDNTLKSTAEQPVSADAPAASSEQSATTTPPSSTQVKDVALDSAATKPAETTGEEQSSPSTP